MEGTERVRGGGRDGESEGVKMTGCGENKCAGSDGVRDSCDSLLHIYLVLPALFEYSVLAPRFSRSSAMLQKENALLMICT